MELILVANHGQGHFLRSSPPVQEWERSSHTDAALGGGEGNHLSHHAPNPRTPDTEHTPAPCPFRCGPRRVTTALTLAIHHFDVYHGGVAVGIPPPPVLGHSWPWPPPARSALAMPSEGNANRLPESSSRQSSAPPLLHLRRSQQAGILNAPRTLAQPSFRFSSGHASLGILSHFNAAHGGKEAGPSSVLS